ncbi:MAG TPA: L-histidine N(alpha)-methyltransferase [Geobacteraceae bacterium]
MKAGYRVLHTEGGSPPAVRFAHDVLQGLSQSPKRTLPVYFYDDRGSALYQRITETPEYYLTRCELEILDTHGGALADRFPRQPFNLVDLGSGDGGKAVVLLKHLLDRGSKFTYTPVDISVEAMRQLNDALERSFTGTELEMGGIVADYFDAIESLKRDDGRASVVLFLGSNIGNMGPSESRAFLQRLRGALSDGDYLLIGFDLKKEPAVIQRAYNDAAGITREFNLNLLDRMNRELGADFDRTGFVYTSYYNVPLGAMESWLVSTRTQEVFIEALQRGFSFGEWEGLHTEYSYKYSRADIRRLAGDAGFVIEQDFADGEGSFVDSLWRAGR